MVAIRRSGDEHSFDDLTVSIALAGDLDAVHTTGENANVIPTDTQKNTVFAFAADGGIGQIEQFALRLARHFVGSFASITRARVEIEAAAWERIGGVHPHAFVQAGGEVRTAVAVCAGAGEWLLSGLRDLVVMKTTGSEFSGFIRDRYTTLKETSDRILCTAVSARWRHGSVDGPDYDTSFAAARAALLERFAATHSLSLQQSLYEMAKGVLDAHPEIVEVRMSLPNRHHFLVDLEPFGLSNEGEIYRVEDRPYGLIEAAIVRDGAPDPGPAWDPYPLI